MPMLLLLLSLCANSHLTDYDVAVTGDEMADQMGMDKRMAVAGASKLFMESHLSVRAGSPKTTSAY